MKYNLNEILNVEKKAMAQAMAYNAAKHIIGIIEIKCRRKLEKNEKKIK